MDALVLDSVEERERETHRTVRLCMVGFGWGLEGQDSFEIPVVTADSH